MDWSLQPFDFQTENITLPKSSKNNRLRDIRLEPSNKLLEKEGMSDYCPNCKIKISWRGPKLEAYSIHKGTVNTRKFRYLCYGCNVELEQITPKKERFFEVLAVFGTCFISFEGLLSRSFNVHLYSSKYIGYSIYALVIVAGIIWTYLISKYQHYKIKR